MISLLNELFKNLFSYTEFVLIYRIYFDIHIMYIKIYIIYIKSSHINFVVVAGYGTNNMMQDYAIQSSMNF